MTISQFLYQRARYCGSYPFCRVTDSTNHKLCDLVIYSSVSSVLVFSDGNSPAIAAIIFASDLFDC